MYNIFQLASLIVYQSVQPSPFGRDCPDFAGESRLDFSRDTNAKWRYFEYQLSQANEQRNIFLLNYHNINLS